MSLSAHLDVVKHLNVAEKIYAPWVNITSEPAGQNSSAVIAGILASVLSPDVEFEPL
jgi:hypothetical protein